MQKDYSQFRETHFADRPLKFSELVNIEELRDFCQSIASISGAAVSIVDPDGNMLLSMDRKDICGRFHLLNPRTENRCRTSHKELSGMMKADDNFIFNSCRNGLVEVAAPISVEGEQVATILFGPLFLAPPGRGFFIRQSEECGFDRESYLEALARVPVYSGEELRPKVEFIIRFARMIGETGLAKKRQEEERARRWLFFDTSPDGALIIDPQTTAFLEFNAAAHRQLGYSREEFSLMKISDVEARETEDETRERIAAVLRDGRGEFETLHRTKEGIPRNVHVTAQMVNLFGRPVYHCVWRDITERKLTEDILKQNAAQYRSLTNTTADAFLIIDIDGRVVEANNESCRLYGYTPEEMRTRTIGDFEAIENFEEIKKRLRTIAGKRYERFETRNRCKDGRVIDVEVSCSFMPESGLFMSFIRNITERKDAELALRKSEEKFYRAFDNAPLVMTISDLDSGTNLDVNRKFCELSGFTREEVLGRPSAEFGWIEPETRQLIQEEMREHGRISGLEVKCRAKDGRKLVMLYHGELIHTGDNLCLLSIALDITDHRRLEAQFRQAQKMESIGRLAGGVAHDFNNMLAVIMGFAELSKASMPRDGQLRKNLDQIFKAAKNSIELTRQLLTFSRKEIISPRAVNMNELIHETEKNLLRLIGEDIRLSFNPSEVIWTTNLDPFQLDQILINLAVNARDAMPNGGELRIGTENLKMDEAACQYKIDATPGEYVRLSFSDSGTGMDKRTMENIFEPFFSTKEPGKGTGLGLATVYGIVTQNGGFIDVQSKVGRGTTFHIYFPRLMGEADNPRESDLSALKGSGTVLLVEDEEIVRHMATKILKKIGYRVINVETPRAAIALCENRKKKIDLILTDVVMPEMNGCEMIERISAIRPGIKVLFMTGYSADLVAQRGICEENMYLIQKPFDMASLNNKIKEILAEGR
jgi:PAS domain S-box-containing protein